MPRPCFPAIYHLPRNLVRRILSSLERGDFIAARWTCWAWYLAGVVDEDGDMSEEGEDLGMRFGRVRFAV